MTLLKSICKQVFVVLCAFSFIACETNRDEVMAIGKKNIMPSETGKDITMMYSDSSVLKIRLQAPQMLTYDKGVKEKVTILPKGVFVVFYDDQGKETTTLKANYGVRYEKHMDVKYDVEVVNVNGEKLNTEHLTWDEEKKKIISNSFVKITTAKEIIMGKGLESNQDFTQYEIKEITGSIKIEDNEL